MKSMLIIALLIASITLSNHAQTVTKTVKIDRITKSVNYFNGKTIIGTVVLDQPPNPKLIAQPVVVTQDSSGFTTTFQFLNPKHQTINDLDLEVMFDKPIISANFAGGMFYFVNMGYNENMTSFHMKAQKVESQTVLVLEIKSKEPIKANIKGLDFAFDQ